MPKEVDVQYMKRKTSTDVTVMRTVGSVSKTIDFIQDNTDTFKNTPVIIHTGTNDVIRERCHVTERRFERLEANLKHHQYAHVAISSIVHRSSAERVHMTALTT